MNIVEALRGIADDLETRGHFKEKDDPHFTTAWSALRTEGRCCLILNPTFYSAIGGSYHLWDQINNEVHALAKANGYPDSVDMSEAMDTAALVEILRKRADELESTVE